MQNGFAYVAAGDRGLVVVDVSDPDNPVEIAASSSIGQARRLAMFKKKRMYVSAGQFGVMVYDITDPTTPEWIDTVDTAEGPVEDIAIGRNLLAVATLEGEIRFYGLKKRKYHQLLATITASDWIQDIRFRGGHLFVLLVGGQVEEYDVRQLSKLRHVGTFDENELSVSGMIHGDTQATLGDAMWLPDTVELHSFVDEEKN